MKTKRRSNVPKWLGPTGAACGIAAVVIAVLQWAASYVSPWFILWIALVAFSGVMWILRSIRNDENTARASRETGRALALTEELFRFNYYSLAKSNPEAASDYVAAMRKRVQELPPDDSRRIALDELRLESPTNK